MDVSGRINGPAVLPPDNQPLVPIELEAEWVREVVWTLWSKYKFFTFRYSNSGRL